MSKCIGVWWNERRTDKINKEMMNEQWNDETLEGLSKSVKHTKFPSALANDEMNIHVKWGEIIIKRKCANINECGNMLWG